MNTPVPSLMKQYGTDDVFARKTAGAEPLLARLGMSILNYELVKGMHEHAQNEKLEEALQAEAAREYQLAKLSPATDALKHTPVPLMVPAGSPLPAGYDEGMVRLASIMESAGAERAKVAGLGDFVNFAKSVGTKGLAAMKGMGGAATPAAGGLMKKLTGPLGVKGTALALGGTAAALYGGSKAMGAAGRYMSSEGSGPSTYGAPARGVGYQMPFGVNQYGQPQVGTPLG